MHSAMHTLTDSEAHLAEQVRLMIEILPRMGGIAATLVPAPWSPAEPVLSASVDFSGAWKGTMTIESTLRLAYAFTAQLMSVPLPDSVDDNVRDALGELVNTVAGNYKAMLPSRSFISIPAVVLKPSSPHGGEDAGLLSKSVFRTDFGDCCVRLQAAQEAQEPQEA